MSEVEVRKCPKCGGELEKGYVVAPRSLGWDTRKPSLKQEFWGGLGSRDSELLTLLLNPRTTTSARKATVLNYFGSAKLLQFRNYS